MRRLHRRLLFGLAAALASGVALFACQIQRLAYSRPAGGGYTVRTFHVLSALRRLDELAHFMPHGGRASLGRDFGYESYLYKGKQRIVRVHQANGTDVPARARDDGKFYAYFSPAKEPVVRIVRAEDGRSVAHALEQRGVITWVRPDLVHVWRKVGETEEISEDALLLDAEFLGQPKGRGAAELIYAPRVVSEKSPRSVVNTCVLLAATDARSSKSESSLAPASGLVLPKTFSGLTTTPPEILIRDHVRPLTESEQQSVASSDGTFLDAELFQLFRFAEPDCSSLFWQGKADRGAVVIRLWDGEVWVGHFISNAFEPITLEVKLDPDASSKDITLFASSGAGKLGTDAVWAER